MRIRRGVIVKRDFIYGAYGRGNVRLMDPFKTKAWKKPNRCEEHPLRDELTT